MDAPKHSLHIVVADLNFGAGENTITIGSNDLGALQAKRNELIERHKAGEWLWIDTGVAENAIPPGAVRLISLFQGAD